MDDLDATEAAFTAACVAREDAIRAVRLCVDNQVEPQALTAALDAVEEATHRAIQARRTLDDVRALAEMSSPPPPYVPGDPAVEAAWVERLEEEWSEAARRLDALSLEYDAVPEVDMSPLDDPRATEEERDRVFRASDERSARVIPLIHALEAAEKEYEAADAALRRATGGQ